VFLTLMQRPGLLSFISFFLVLSTIERDGDAHEYITSLCISAEKLLELLQRAAVVTLRYLINLG
jgi:hypothetical protein